MSRSYAARPRTQQKIPLGNVGLTKSQVDALFAKGYRIIAGLDILRLKAAAVETRSWTKSNMAT